MEFSRKAIQWEGFEPHYFPCMRDGCKLHATEMVHLIVEEQSLFNFCLCPGCADRVEGTETLAEMNAFMEKGGINNGF